MTISPPSRDALLMAIDWLNAFEPAPGDDVNPPLASAVADYLVEILKAHAVKEAETEAIKLLAAERGVSASTIRYQLKHARTAKRNAARQAKREAELEAREARREARRLRRI